MKVARKKTHKLFRNFTRRSKLPVSLRKSSSEIFYAQSKKAGFTKPLLDESAIKEWRYWRLIDNAFPYDAVFSVHHMLIPCRVVTEGGLTASERAEMTKITRQLSREYDCYLVNFENKQSIKSHFHIHFLIYKTNRSELKF